MLKWWASPLQSRTSKISTVRSTTTPRGTKKCCYNMLPLLQCSDTYLVLIDDVKHTPLSSAKCGLSVSRLLYAAVLLQRLPDMVEEARPQPHRRQSSCWITQFSAVTCWGVSVHPPTKTNHLKVHKTAYSELTAP